MIPYKVTFIMQVGCPGIADVIREAVQKMLHDKGMAQRTITSVQVTEITESR